MSIKLYYHCFFVMFFINSSERNSYSMSSHKWNLKKIECTQNLTPISEVERLFPTYSQLDERTVQSITKRAVIQRVKTTFKNKGMKECSLWKEKKKDVINLDNIFLGIFFTFHVNNIWTSGLVIYTCHPKSNYSTIQKTCTTSSSKSIIFSAVDPS